MGTPHFTRRGAVGSGVAAWTSLLTQSAAAAETAPEDFLKALRAALGADAVLTGDAITQRYLARRQTERPLAVALPKSTAEVSAVLKLCHAAKQPVVPQGGMTGLVDGAVGRPGEIILSTDRMTEIADFDADNRTLTAGAGVRLQALQEYANERGFLMPVDIGSRATATIGGMAATNAGGLQVVRYGMMREAVLGIEVVLADGTVVSSMNRMIKNNAGPDVKQVFIGSEGTLGIVTRAVLRLRPKPAGMATAYVAIDRFENVLKLLRLFEAQLAGALTSFEIMWDDYDAFVRKYCPHLPPPLKAGHKFYLLIEADGGDPASDRARFDKAFAAAKAQNLIAEFAIARDAEERAAYWAIREQAGAQFIELGPFFGYDVSMPISDMERYGLRVKKELSAAFPKSTTLVMGHIGDGNLHLIVAPGGRSPEITRKANEIVYGAVRALGGSVSAEHGVGTLKKEYLAWSRTPEEIALMRTFKRALDPAGILNPGKVL